MEDLRTIAVTRKDGCATIRFSPPLLVHKDGQSIRPGRHRELGIALDRLRFDNEICEQHLQLLAALELQLNYGG